MSNSETFKGYGPEQGYEATRAAIADYYKKNGIEVDPLDIFISDGAKSDTGNITDLFGPGNVILIPDPVYPVYVDTNLMNGRKILYMNANAENGSSSLELRTISFPSISVPLIAGTSNGEGR